MNDHWKVLYKIYVFLCRSEITSVHNDTVTIVATDVAGNETEQLITVSVKILARGFIINGKNAGDKSGFSVSNAGDVNGDGLDDLIVGAHNAEPSGKSTPTIKSSKPSPLTSPAVETE
jgi:hypothetical protein